MKKVQIGDTVTVNYTGRLEDGIIFDSSLNEGREPLKSVLGQNQLIPGFEQGLLDMSIGDKKTIEIEPNDAYGEYYPDRVTTISKSQVPQDVKVGETLQGMSPQGPIIIKILEIDGDNLVIDANHPLAGKKLIFDLELLEIAE
jgi:FKBP-type peptidyl-prolyl cis-trans isomerase SlpA